MKTDALPSGSTASTYGRAVTSCLERVMWVTRDLVRAQPLDTIRRESAKETRFPRRVLKDDFGRKIASQAAAMSTRVSLTELTEAGVRLKPAEAAAIVVEICSQRHD